MQRSTISLIVEELIKENWVIEGPTGRLPRGRRPTLLRLNEDRVIIGVDIRPTQITLALADVNGRFTSQEVMPTPREPETALRELTSRMQRLLESCRGKKVEGVGISVPGRVDPVTKHLVFAPNLRWPACDLRGPIESATGLEVEIENAANACVLAAVWFEHVRSECMVVVTVSEGIGTGILVNGQLVRGASGMAGEFGHVPLDPTGPTCGCGGRGCWEVFASTRAALRYYFEDGEEQGGLNFSDLISRAEQGEPQAARALETMAHYLGRGMRMLVAGLNPELILMVGDLTRAWHRFGPVIEAEVKAQTLPGAVVPRVLPMHEGAVARLRGTIALVLQKHFGTNSLVAA